MTTAALSTETEKLLRQAALATDKQKVSPLDVATSRILAVRAVVQEMRLLREQFFLGVGFTAGTGAVDPPENLAAQALASVQADDPKQIAAADRGAMRMLCLEMAELFQRLFVQGGLAKMLTTLEFFNGSFLESFDATIASDGATITMSVEKAGTGDLTMVFSDGLTTFDCTPAATITLTAGTDEVPQRNYIYILQSGKVLAKSTTAWPTAEHIRIDFVYVQSASLVNTGAVGNNYALINHNLNDHASDTITSQGHGQHITERVRRVGASWESGTQGVATQDGNDLWVSVSAGVVFQMHRHVFAALDSDTAGAGDSIAVVNDPDVKFVRINSLNQITKHSDGVLIGNNKYLKLVLFAVANKGGEVSLMMLNLPSGHYNTADDARTDVEGHANFTIPTAFATDSSTGFLIAAFVCKHTATAMEIQETIDLRGTIPGTAPGSGAGGGDVSAHAVLVDGAVIVGDGGAKDVKTTGVLVDGSNNISGVGNISLSGTVDGEDIQALKKESSFCFWALETEMAF